MSLFGTSSISSAQKVQLAQMTTARKAEEDAQQQAFQQQLTSAGVSMSPSDVNKTADEYTKFNSNCETANTVMGAGAGLALGCVAQSYMGEDSTLGKWMPIIGAVAGGVFGDDIFGQSQDARMATFVDNGSKSEGFFTDIFA